MKIGILSDTHGFLREEVKEGLTGVDHIIHAGDIETSLLGSAQGKAFQCHLVKDSSWILRG